MNNSLGNRLEKIKKNERLSIDEYMELLGVTKTSYYNWRDGKNSPNADVLVKVLMKYPKYSADWLLMGIGDMHRGQNAQQVNDSVQEYGMAILRKQVDELTQKLQILSEKFTPKDEIIRHQGEIISEKRYGLSSQKRHKKDDDKT